MNIDMGGNTFILAAVTNNIIGIANFYLYILSLHHSDWNPQIIQQTSVPKDHHHLSLYSSCFLRPQGFVKTTIMFAKPQFPTTPIHTNVSKNNNGNAFAQPKTPNIVMENLVMYYGMTLSPWTLIVHEKVIQSPNFGFKKKRKNMFSTILLHVFMKQWMKTRWLSLSSSKIRKWMFPQCCPNFKMSMSSLVLTYDPNTLKFVPIGWLLSSLCFPSHLIDVHEEEVFQKCCTLHKSWAQLAFMEA